MRINTNVSSMIAQESNTDTNVALASSLEKLSTGLKVNRAADNASGMSIADKLRTQASSLGQVIENGNSAIALTQIVDKAMGEQSNILDIIKTKLVQASTATTTTAGVAAISADIAKLTEQLDNIASKTNYNGMTLLQDSATSTAVASNKDFQMGEFSGNVITFGGTSVGDGQMQSNLLGLSLVDVANLSVGTNTEASALLDDIDNALSSLNSMRANVGATQNQMEASIRNLNTTVTNLKVSESIIRDVDYAQESANFNKQNIVSQAGTYALTQANTVPQSVLNFLQ